MNKALDFVRMRLHQLGVTLEVYRELGPSYSDQLEKVTAVIGELRGIETAIETFISVEEYNIKRNLAETLTFED